jgi:hypothetical protein
MNVKTYSDAAKRCADTVTLHATAGNTMKWCAIRLSDGGSDNIVYDKRSDAVRHQLWEQLCAYVQVQPGGMQAKEAEVFLAYHRALYDAGYRLPDPEFQQPYMPLNPTERRAQIDVLTRK